MTEILTGSSLATSAGFNTWIPFLVLATMARMDFITIEEPYGIFASVPAMVLYMIFFLLEFVVDKITIITHAYNAFMTLVRPIAGGILFIISTSGVQEHFDDATLELIGGIISFVIGLLVTGVIHMVKLMVRPVIDFISGGVTTLGIGNALASLAEDVMSVVLAVGGLLISFFACCLIPIAVFPFGLVLLYAFNNRKNLPPQAQPLSPWVAVATGGKSSYFSSAPVDYNKLPKRKKGRNKNDKGGGNPWES